MIVDIRQSNKSQKNLVEMINSGKSKRTGSSKHRKRPRRWNHLDECTFECNGLANLNDCICDPNVCLAENTYPKQVICYCVNSFLRGSDAVVYHTSCNCCEGLENVRQSISIKGHEIVRRSKITRGSVIERKSNSNIILESNDS